MRFQMERIFMAVQLLTGLTDWTAWPLKKEEEKRILRPGLTSGYKRFPLPSRSAQWSVPHVVRMASTAGA